LFCDKGLNWKREKTMLELLKQYGIFLAGIIMMITGLVFNDQPFNLSERGTLFQGKHIWPDIIGVLGLLLCLLGAIIFIQ
jgi:hypothetical protein